MILTLKYIMLISPAVTIWKTGKKKMGRRDAIAMGIKFDPI